MSLDNAATLFVFIAVTTMAITHVIKVDVTLKKLTKYSDCITDKKGSVADVPQKE